MHPNYDAALRAMETGTGVVALPVGALGRVTLAGQFHGYVGKVVKRSRTRYHLEHADGVLTVPSCYVEPAGSTCRSDAAQARSPIAVNVTSNGVETASSSSPSTWATSTYVPSRRL